MANCLFIQLTFLCLLYFPFPPLLEVHHNGLFLIVKPPRISPFTVALVASSRCVRTFKHTFTSTHSPLHTHMHIHTCFQSCTLSSSHPQNRYTHTHAHTQRHTQHECKHMRRHTHTYTPLSTHISVCMYVCTCVCVMFLPAQLIPHPCSLHGFVRMPPVYYCNCLYDFC